MKIISNEKKEKNVELVVEIGREEFDAAIDKVYKKVRGNLQVPGFRKGKATRKVIEGMYGAGVFYEDAIKEIYPEAYAQAIEESGADVVGYPDMEVLNVDHNGFTFKATVALRPEVKLGAYKELTAAKPSVKVTAADVDAELQKYIDRASRLVSVERAAALGDTTVIDYEGFLNGVPFDGGKDEGHELKLGSNSFIPGFEDGVVGMNIGEEKDITLTFPEEYHAADLAGKEVVFHVKLNEVKESQAPEVDDEFAKDVSEFETLKEFKADLKAKLTANREAGAEEEFHNNVLQQVMDNAEVEIPDSMLEMRVDEMVEDFSRRITSQGFAFEQYLEMTGITVEMIQEQARPEALRQLKFELVMGAVFAAEGMEITDEDVEAEFNKLAEQYGMPVEQVKKYVAVSAIKQDITTRMARDVIYDTAKAGKATAKKATKKAAEKVEEAAEGEEKPKKTRKTTKKAEEKTEE